MAHFEKNEFSIIAWTGFWSIQCALLGAEVIGFDARIDLINQANLIKSIVGIDNVEFKVLDFWDMSPQCLHGTFDVVLNSVSFIICQSLLKRWS